MFFQFYPDVEVGWTWDVVNSLELKPGVMEICFPDGRPGDLTLQNILPFSPCPLLPYSDLCRLVLPPCLPALPTEQNVAAFAFGSVNPG